MIRVTYAMRDIFQADVIHQSSFVCAAPNCFLNTVRCVRAAGALAIRATLLADDLDPRGWVVAWNWKDPYA